MPTDMCHSVTSDGDMRKWNICYIKYYNMILNGADMMYTTGMLLDELRDYANPACRLQRLVRDGKYTQVVRGLYESDPNTPGHLLATAIRSPSYLSFEYALSVHGIIPEAVRVYTSATWNTHRTKTYHTPFGTFTYRDSPKAAFHLGVEFFMENDRSYRLAEPVKAVCDELYIKPPVNNYRELEELMFDDLRMDEDIILGLDVDDVSKLAGLYHCRNVTRLAGYLRRKGC